MNKITEFFGVLKVTPKHPYPGKPGPFLLYGHWERKNVGQPHFVWCDDANYKSGISEAHVEIEIIPYPT